MTMDELIKLRMAWDEAAKVHQGYGLLNTADKAPDEAAKAMVEYDLAYGKMANARSRYLNAIREFEDQ